jgi:hypothetical protein
MIQDLDSRETPLCADRCESKELSREREREREREQQHARRKGCFVWIPPTSFKLYTLRV